MSQHKAKRDITSANISEHRGRHNVKLQCMTCEGADATEEITITLRDSAGGEYPETWIVCITRAEIWHIR